MIPDQWYAIERAELVKRKPRHVRRMGDDLVLWRDSRDVVHAMIDRCPHKGVRLSEGRVVGDELVCAYHGFRYGADGRCTHMPVLGRAGKPPRGMCARVLPVREQHGFVWLWWGDARPAAERPPIPMFDCMRGRDWTWSSYAWIAPVHYTRYVESIAEIYHVPILHMSRFNFVDTQGTRMDDLKVEVDGNHIKSSFYMRPDDDRPVEQTLEAWYPPNRGWYNELEILMPNMTLGRFPPADIMVINTPVDEQNTWTCWTYSGPRGSLLLPPRAPRLPALPRPLIKAYTWFFARYERLMPQRQDARLMRHQTPRVAEQGDCILTVADKLNIAYLKARDRLKREAAARRDAPVTIAEPRRGRHR